MNYLELLYDALHADLGVVVETNDPERLRQKLYTIRKGYPEFECISFWISPFYPDTELWIGKSREPTEG